MVVRQGLQWVVDMYTTGECDDYRWAYDRMAPTMLELAETAERSASTASLAPTTQVCCLMIKPLCQIDDASPEEWLQA